MIIRDRGRFLVPSHNSGTRNRPLSRTVGYGDIYPVSWIGRAIAMSSSFFGIAVVALPAGIITAGYMSELRKDKEQFE